MTVTTSDVHETGMLITVMIRDREGAGYATEQQRTIHIQPETSLKWRHSMICNAENYSVLQFTEFTPK